MIENIEEEQEEILYRGKIGIVRELRKDIARIAEVRKIGRLAICGLHSLYMNSYTLWKEDNEFLKKWKKVDGKYGEWSKTIDGYRKSIHKEPSREEYDERFCAIMDLLARHGLLLVPQTERLYDEV